MCGGPSGGPSRLGPWNRRQVTAVPGHVSVAVAVAVKVNDHVSVDDHVNVDDHERAAEGLSVEAGGALQGAPCPFRPLPARLRFPTIWRQN